MNRGMLSVALSLVASLLSAPASASPGGSEGEPPIHEDKMIHDDSGGPPEQTDGCAPEINAAAQLVHPGAEIVATGRIGGVPSALLSLPVVTPGVRHRLVRSGGLWCDAIGSFNVLAAGRSPRALAETFALLAPAPYFDGVTVTGARADGRLVRLQTHARTNGVVAEWTVRVDGAGILEASWTATGVGAPPFEKEWEGPLVRPGTGARYVRRDGKIIPSRSPGPEPSAPTVPYDTVQMSDGFAVEIRWDPAGPGTPGLDIPAVIRDLTKTQYEDFLAWGLHGGWSPAGLGVVEIDDDLASFCGACVQFSAGFNVHIASDFIPFIETVGYDWPDDRLGFSTVVGHEVYHNFQFASGAQTASRVVLESTARFQESLHDDSIGNYQRGSGVYATTGGRSTCNDYVPSGVAVGPGGHFYDTCRFWLSWYADHGLEDFVALTEHLPGGFRQVVERAGGRPYADDLSAFVGRMLVPRGMVWGPADGSGPAADWGALLNVWRPPFAAVPVAGLLQSSGTIGLEIDRDVVALAAGAVSLFVVRDDGHATTVEPVVAGGAVRFEPGERAWVVAIPVVEEPTPVVLAAV